MKAYYFIHAAWHNDNTAWLTHNQCVREAAILAVRLFDWYYKELDNVLAIRNARYSIHKCLGEGGEEHLYTVAVQCGNETFCREYERWAKRPPIIVDDVNGRQKDRLCIGSKFQWNGEMVTVTSFNAAGAAIACSYTTTPGESCPKCRGWLKYGETKLKKRYKITRDDVIAARKKVVTS